MECNSRHPLVGINANQVLDRPNPQPHPECHAEYCGKQGENANGLQLRDLDPVKFCKLRLQTSANLLQSSACVKWCAGQGRGGTFVARKSRYRNDQLQLRLQTRDGRISTFR